MVNRIHQLLHGYKQGHQLLAGSLRLDAASADLIGRLSDLSGGFLPDTRIPSYLTAYPLPDAPYYALAKTWLDEKASRAGCVLTHTLLVPQDEWSYMSEPSDLARLFKRPLDRDDLKLYRTTIAFDFTRMPHGFQPLEGVPWRTDEDSEVEQQSALIAAPSSATTAFAFINRYFGQGVRPLAWFGERNPDGVFWHLVRALWPDLRSQFACCTFSLQPRTVESRPFDLLLAPLLVRSRFHSLTREHRLDEQFLASSSPGSEERSMTNEEPWCRDWACYVFPELSLELKGGPEHIPWLELDELQSLLGNEPTAIRKVFLMRELRQRVWSSPTAAIGLLDVLESLAPEPERALDTKEKLLDQAIAVARATSSSEEALRCLLLTAERLERPAFARLSSRVCDELHSAVMFWARKDLHATLSIGERLLIAPEQSQNSVFARSVRQALVDLARTALRENAQAAHSELLLLRRFPSLTLSLIAEEPAIAKSYLSAFRTSEKYGSAEDDEQAHIVDLTNWVASLKQQDVRRQLRRLLLPEMSSPLLSPLLQELLVGLSDEEVPLTLDTLFGATQGFRQKPLFHIIQEQVAQPFADSVRHWARSSPMWSGRAADLVRSTYPLTAEGLTQLLNSPLPDVQRQVSVVFSFLADLSGSGPPPNWLRQYAKESADFLLPLLTFEGDINNDLWALWHDPSQNSDEDALHEKGSLQDTQSNLQRSTMPGEVVYDIVAQLPDVALAKHKDLVSRLPNWREWGWSVTPESPLIDRALRGAIAGYVDGTLDWATCEAWYATPEGVQWLQHVADWELCSLVRPSSSYRVSNEGKSAGGLSRAWRWLACAPDSLYTRKPSVLPKLTEVLAASQSRDWDQTMTDHWLIVLQRAARHASKSTRFQLLAHALDFAFAHRYSPVSPLIVKSFWPVYDHLTRTKDEAQYIRTFGFFDWDKGKGLRREIVRAFTSSNWPPSDLVLAIPETNLLRKIFKRIRREHGGEAYIDAVLADLARRPGPAAQKGRKLWLELAHNPNFFEPWI